MRVIAGAARGRQLIAPAGTRVRPTSDRVKEALFSTLTSRFGSIAGLAVLDLFAGSGALGIEALSRGAIKAVFVDSHPESIQLIGRNLQLTGFNAGAQIIRMDALKALNSLSSNVDRFDIIFADPPYALTDHYGQLLSGIRAGHLLAPDGTVVLEADSRTNLQLPDHLQLQGKKAYGDTTLWFLGNS
jgi:16S rRNA (guanine(966)-N(2))-methyltransferase RsmD